VARWLVKSDPEDYAFADLERDGRTEWTGVHNALALRHLRSMAPGDAVLVYHSGGERAAVGLARVESVPRPDPRDARGSWTVTLAATRRLARAIPLDELRRVPGLDGFVLFRMGRLSVLPVSAREWARVLARESLAAAPRPTGSPAARARATGSPRRGSAERRRR